MCYEKPGPRCSNHAAQTLAKAKAGLIAARKSGIGIEEATLALAEARIDFNSTRAGQGQLERLLAKASTVSERESYTKQMLDGRILRAQQATALKRKMNPEEDYSSIDPVEVDHFIGEDGEEKIHLTHNGEVIKTFYRKETTEKILNEESWKYNKTLPYKGIVTSSAALYADKKTPSWQMGENINTSRVNDMLPEGYHASREGSSDSTVSDRAIKHNNKTLGYVEVKMEKAQSGQIVVSQDENGNYNASDQSNPHTSRIVELINEANASDNPAKYLSSLNEADQKTVNSWFCSHYEHKNAAFIAVTDSTLNYTSVFPLSKLESHAKISVFMPRAKSSGSGRLPKKDYPVAQEILQTEHKDHFVSMSEKDGKTYVKLSADKGGYVEKSNYFLSPVESTSTDSGEVHTYEVRKISAVKNPTIMFNFEYTGDKKTGGKGAISRWLQKQEN
jgi:hypothetical protein